MEKNYNYTKLDHPDVLLCVFHPRKEIPAPKPPGALDHEMLVAGSVTIGCRFYLTDPTYPHILFFHGNGEIVGDYDDVGPLYNSHGLNLLAVDYRGYGRSTGTPTVTSMIDDAHIIYREVQTWLKNQHRAGPLFVMGRSLGSASALELASHYASELAGLIIESGFAYTVPLLSFLGVDTAGLGITEADCLRHTEKIAQFPKPTLIVHAEFDQFIPVTDARKFYELSPAKKKELKIIPGADHNSIFMVAGKHYFEIIKNFLI